MQSTARGAAASLAFFGLLFGTLGYLRYWGLL